MQSDSWPPKTSNIIGYIKDIPPHLLIKMPATIVTGTFISTLFQKIMMKLFILFNLNSYLYFNIFPLLISQSCPS